MSDAKSGQPTAAAGNSPYQEFRFPLEAQPGKVLSAGSAKQVTAAELPISQDIAGVSMWLQPGAVRELHWHPNAAEWFYILEGQMRMTLFQSQGQAQTAAFDAGDVGYVPAGNGHYLENTGPGHCRVLLGFNAGTYEQISLSGWLAANPRQLVAFNFSLPLATIERFPSTTEIFAAGQGA